MTKPIFAFKKIVLKIINRVIIGYLVIFLTGCSTPPRVAKPPTSVARAMETRTFEGNLITILKASINSLQDMDYTIEVLNSDIGLITASRTSEDRKANLTNDLESNEELSAGEQACLIAGAAVAVILFISFLDSIFDGENSNNRENNRWPSSNSNRNNNEPDGPIIYRYKVTINITESDNNQTKVRVSASGEAEQDGKILSTGGIHELEFFSKFFAGMNQGLFLDKNSN